MDKLSKDYYECLTAAAKHHAESKTYSGKLLRPHARYIYELLQRVQGRSLLDYGCGKGSQYEWISHGGENVPAKMTIEEFWGISVFKYDPAWPPFAEEPLGRFDVVICTHTLGAIPVQDLDTIVERLMDFATDAVFIAEKIGAPKKVVYKETGAKMPHGWQRDDWLKLLRPHVRDGIELHLSTRERTSEGTIVTREIL